MNTNATHLPNTAAKVALRVAPKMRVWAFAAAVRLSDQDKPIALKLLVELAIVIRMLALLAKQARCPTGKTVIAHRAPRGVKRASVARVNTTRRAAAVHARVPGVVAMQRQMPGTTSIRPSPRARGHTTLVRMQAETRGGRAAALGRGS